MNENLNKFVLCRVEKSHKYGQNTKKRHLFVLLERKKINFKYSNKNKHLLNFGQQIPVSRIEWVAKYIIISFP